MTNTSDFEKLLTGIRSKLPIQNPLHSFVHNNILQMFESKDFHEAVREAGKLYRARTYWPLEKYKECFDQGKIHEEDIMEGLNHYLGYNHEIKCLPIMGLTPREFFYRLMFSELNFNDDEVQPELNDERLWMFCREKVKNAELVLSRSPVIWRGKSYWERHHNILYNLSIHPFLTRLVGSFLDQGQSFWHNPFSQEGFWKFLCYDIKQTGNFLSGWQKIFAAKLAACGERDPGEVIMEELRKTNIPEDKWESYLLDILFDLKGWSGMVNKLELEPWQASVKAPKIRLADFIAAALLVELSVDEHFAQMNSIDLSLIRGRREEIKLHGFQLSLALYQVAHYMKLDERWVQRLNVNEALQLIDEVDAAEDRHKVPLWHEAFEHHFYRNALSALMHHRKKTVEAKDAMAQLFFCIDDREESIRRHIEEVNPNVLTYGVVGFFGIDMKFASLKNDRLIAQCPPVVTPSRIVTEVSLERDKGTLFTKFNNFLGITDLAFYYQSRTLFRGIVTTLVLGTMSIFPMFLQVFFPERAKKLKGRIFSAVTPEPKTEIHIEKTDDLHGYDVNEQTAIVKNIFDQCGLRENFSSLVVLLAHGSSSTNNPFKQAYGCGACGGNAGIPNSRAFAKMANDKRVRENLKQHGIIVPDSTRIVSGFHDTCTDDTIFFDNEDLTEESARRLTEVKKVLAEATKRNALERCQRFSLPIARKSAEAAKAHVQERSLDPAQPRPEYGHSRNALAIVAKRDLTHGLFLNRRSFLHTYDWEIDPDGTILANVVIGGVPVACNINMDYYFSLVDNDNFGCGSKLPLNLTSLLGVMTGSQGDLRIGLARQMVEIHEPVRVMTVIEAPFERVQKLFEGHKRLSNIMHQHWLRLCVHDPITDKWHLYTHKSWRELSKEKMGILQVKSSMELLPKVKDLDFAEIRG